MPRTLACSTPLMRHFGVSLMTTICGWAFSGAMAPTSLPVMILARRGSTTKSSTSESACGGAISGKRVPRTTWPGNARSTWACVGAGERSQPTIAMVHGACIAGGLMLAWACDLIIAADDAVFSDPVVQWGVPGVELFAHPWEMGARQAKEFLFLGEPIGAQRAFELGMVNRVVPRDALEDTALDVARRIASKPRFGLALAKMAVNQSEDAMGYRVGTDQAFALHQLSHAHNLAVSGSPMLGRAVPTGSAQPPDPAGH